MKKKLIYILYSVFLSAFAIYTLLDAFVIPKNIVSVEEIAQAQSPVYTIEEAEQKAAQAEEELKETDSEDIQISSNSYKDDHISIEISEQREYDTTIYIADVKLDDPEYLKAGLSQGVFGQNVSAKTSEIAADTDAILAINGDYYGFRDRGYVVRNGYLYRDSQGSYLEDLVIDSDGNFEIINESQISAQDLLEQGAIQVFSFGPALVEDGQVAVSQNTEVDQAMRSNPRTAIGQIDELHYVFVVSDGRTDESAGLSLYELAGVMQELGCKTAYNLDGGGSSTMVFMGEVINNPTSGRGTKERSVSDIVYIG